MVFQKIMLSVNRLRITLESPANHSQNHFGIAPNESLELKYELTPDYIGCKCLSRDVA